MFIFTCKKFLDPFSDYWIRKLENDKQELQSTQSKLERKVVLLELRNSYLHERLNTYWNRIWDIELEEQPVAVYPDSLWQPWLFDDLEHQPSSWVSELFTLTH